ncbi:SCO family protein [Pedobacter rhizosphaerae]|nr:SCO family protein [Pedobacter rhizosphaerae]
MKKKLTYSFFALLLFSCTNTETKLPFLGNPSTLNGEQVYPVIKPFSFINQDSIKVTNQNFRNKIYIADFMFLSCPTICPKMTMEMRMVYDTFKDDPRVMFLSHTIDPKNDTVERLKKYAANLGVKSAKWNFVTGNRDSIYAIAKDSYYATAYADKTAPGGYIHSGGLLLVDTNQHIRGVYDGTDPEDTKRLISEINLLLKEK